MGAQDLKRIFPTFDDQLIRQISRVGSEVQLNDGDLLVRTGQYFKSSLLILDGRVKLFREGQNGEEFFLYYLESGDACALSIICAAREQASEIKGRAVTPVRALAIPLEHVDRLMKEYKQWYYFVLDTYRKRFEELLLVIDQIAFHSMDQKLEFYLRRQFESGSTKTITITHQEIANDLNSSREVISRLLKKMESHGKISFSRNEIMNVSL